MHLVVAFALGTTALHDECNVVLLQLTNLLEGLWSKDGELDVYKTDFIVIGPIDQFIQISTGELVLLAVKININPACEDRYSHLLCSGSMSGGDIV